MEKTYVIKWKAKLGAVQHQSKKLFSREEAEQLADELNQDHPEFTHEAYNLRLVGDSTTEPVQTPEDTGVVQNIDFTPRAEFKLSINEVVAA